MLLARRLGLKPLFGVLSGGAVAICGASAALAIASVLPRNDTRERDTILTVVSVTALSTLAMILYPVFATSIGLDHKQAGIFIGGTIHDVAQVVGAGYTISNETGDIATYVKLLQGGDAAAHGVRDIISHRPTRRPRRGRAGDAAACS